jgi:hypothetical protein
VNESASIIVSARSLCSVFGMLRGGYFAGLRLAVFLHQIHRLVCQLEKMRVRAIPVSENREAKFAIAIAEQERGIATDASAVREITIAIPNLCPPG